MEENITLDEFKTVIKWFEYSINLKKAIKEPLINSIKKEYFFFNSNWIEAFKKTFRYEELKQQFTLYKNKNNINNPLNDNEISILYNKYQAVQISKENKEKIKRINNDLILNPYLRISDNFEIKNYYNNFVLLNPNIYEELRKNYYISQSIKRDIILGDGIFIIELPNNCIEIGAFNTIYEYKIILFLIFFDEKEEKEEIEKLKKYKLNGYLKLYDINDTNFSKIESQIIRKKNEKEIILINLMNFNANNNKNNLNKNKSKNDFDISKKRGFINYDKQSSRMNSIFQILTSIKDIKFALENERNLIQEYNHIYILSSILLKLYDHLYGKEENDEIKKLGIILNFMDPQNANKSLDQYLLFILDTLNDELNKSEKKKTERISLLSYDSPFNTEINSFKIFEEYYRNYYKSAISEMFHLIRKRNIICLQCKLSSLFSFQAFPYLTFDLKIVHEYIITEQTQYRQILNKFKNNEIELNQKKKEYLKAKEFQPIHLINCFEYYLKSKEYLNFECNMCGQITKYSSNNLIFKSPKLLFIILNREPYSNVKLLFDEELNLETYVEMDSKFKKYKLIGVLISLRQDNNDEKYYTILRNSDPMKKWIKFNDEKVEIINDKEVFNQNNIISLLIYEGTKY